MVIKANADDDLGKARILVYDLEINHNNYDQLTSQPEQSELWRSPEAMPCSKSVLYENLHRIEWFKVLSHTNAVCNWLQFRHLETDLMLLEYSLRLQ